MSIHYLECPKRKCDWIGLDSELVRGESRVESGMEVRDMVCPKCGHDEHYTVKVLDACMVTQKEAIVRYAADRKLDNAKAIILHDIEGCPFFAVRVKQKSYSNLTAKLTSLAKRGVLIRLPRRPGEAIRFVFPLPIMERLIDETIREGDFG